MRSKKRKVRSYFSYLLVRKRMYSSQNRYLSLRSFRVNSSGNIKINYTVNVEHKIH